MPPRAIADWEAVKATAIATGSLIEAADHHRINYDAVKMRASREKWPVGRRVIKQLEEAKRVANEQLAKAGAIAIKPVVTSVTTASEAIEGHLKEHGAAARMSLARATRKGAARAEELTGDEILAQARAIKEIAGTASIVHGWSAGDSGNKVQVNIFNDPT